MKRIVVVAVVTLALLGILGWAYWEHRGSGDRRNAGKHADSASPVAGLSSITVDKDGNLFVCARKLNRVFKISRGGEASVAAGDGKAGYGGDGGPATDASLAEPMSVALNSAGDLFIADMGNNRVRKVDAKTGVIHTVAGNGTMGGTSGAAAVSTGLYEPVSIAFDRNDDLYIGGTTGQAIRRVDAITGISIRVIGASLPGLPTIPEPAVGPFWVTAGKGDEIFFSDPTRNSVHWFDTATNTSRRMAGSAVCGFAGDGGPSSGALLCFPEGLLADHADRLLIADSGNNRIRALNLTTGVISTLAGVGRPGYSGDNGPAANAELNGPASITEDAQGNVYIADTGNDCVRSIAAGTGIITTVFDAGAVEGVRSR